MNSNKTEERSRTRHTGCASALSAPDKHKYTVTVQQMPFLRYDNKSDTSRILIFVSDDALRILGDISRWHSDGEC